MKVETNTPIYQQMTKQAGSALEATDNQDFEAIVKSKLKSKDQKKLYDACQELESVFLSKVMESMRSTIERSDFIPRSFAQDTFESMLYDEYAKSMSKTGSLGIADIIYKQLVGAQSQTESASESEPEVEVKNQSSV